MRSLFLDLGSSTGTLACATEKDVAAIAAIDHRMDDGQLVAGVESLLAEATWTYSDITQLACVLGPGGFTSLRVGCAVANALGWALKIPVAGVRLWEVYERRAGGQEGKRAERQEVVWLHSTKKTHVFIKQHSDTEPRCVTLDELRLEISASKSIQHWTGELIPEHRTIATELGLGELALKPLATVLPSYLAGLTYAPGITLIPWYGRGW